MEFTKKFTLDLENHREQLNDALNTNLYLAQVSDNSIWSFLEESEDQFMQLMDNPMFPPNPSGIIEFGWCLSFLNGRMPNIPPDIQSIIEGERGIKELLRHRLVMPDSRITKIQWEQWMIQLNGPGILKGDGTLVSTARYALLDARWVISFLHFLSVKLGIREIVSFNNHYKTIEVPLKSTLQVALFGDWGTGAYKDGDSAISPSQQVMQQIQKLEPDMAIHLGDVYYSGTNYEEHANLVSSWTYKALLGNFTLNSNHEMYFGGQGLFNIALNSAITQLFWAQEGATFFCISFGNWLILGLDSAYYASQRNMYQDGAIIDAAQIQLLRDAKESGKRIMILTHHNALNEIGDDKCTLWANVTDALGKDPDYWYWGHVHNGIVYSEKSAGGSVKCRCLGNAAIPIGHASSFENKPSISFYTDSPLGDTDPRNALRIKNGFALLEFDENSVRENWYYQDGSLAWASSLDGE